MRTGRSSGFTIIEVLIVLAVAGAMLISALLLVSGRQNVTSFNQSIRNVQNEMQQVVNEVGSGYYQNDGNITCLNNGGKVRLTSGSKQHGTNIPCTFIGKVVQFSVGNSDPEEYNVYTVAGLTGNSINPSSDLDNSGARVIARATGEPTNVPDTVFENKRLLYGLTVSQTYLDNNTNAYVVVAFTSNVSSLAEGDGSQQVNTSGVKNTKLALSRAAGVKLINENLRLSELNPAGGVHVCFNSGGTDHSGLLTIGGSGRQSIVELKIFVKQDCQP